MSITLCADDLDPPLWRGDDGSTFQQWEFRFLPSAAKNQRPANCVPQEGNKTPWGQRGPPDNFDNPFQEQSGVCIEYKTMWAITDRIDWLVKYHGREGVWRLKSDPADFNSIDFIVPNKLSQKADSNDTQVQITYEGIAVHPTVKILILLSVKDKTYTYLQPINEYQSGILPEGWLHRTFRFKTDFCPRFENIQIIPPDRDEIYIDQVVVDTVCREPDN